MDQEFITQVQGCESAQEMLLRKIVHTAGTLRRVGEETFIMAIVALHSNRATINSLINHPMIHPRVFKAARRLAVQEAMAIDFIVSEYPDTAKAAIIQTITGQAYETADIINATIFG